MGRRSTAFAFELSKSFHDEDSMSGSGSASVRVEQAFPIRWETFQEDLHREAGFVDFLIVDDFTSCNIWDDLLSTGIARVGLRPEGYRAREDCATNVLPEGKWRMLHAMRPLAADELYARAGISKPCSTKLPAVYCLVHGQVMGGCIFNASLDTAIDFIKTKIEPLLAANDDSVEKGR